MTLKNPSLHHPLLPTSTPVVQGDRNEGSSQVVSFSAHRESFPCSDMSPPHKQVLHKLLQLGSLFHRVQCSGTACSSVGPHRVKSPTRKPAWSLFQGRISVSSQPPSGMHLLQQGLLHVSGSLPPCAFHGLQGTAVSPWAAPRAAGESQFWSLGTSCLFSTDLSPQLFLSHVLTLL